MGSQIILVIALSFIVHLIITLSYSMWIVGTRTGKIAISFSLFNLLVIVSRTANTIQSPILAKHVEQNILLGIGNGGILDFRLVLFSTTVATIIGGVLIPSFQRLMSSATEAFASYRSVPRLLLRSISSSGFFHVLDSFTFPSAKNITQLRRIDAIPLRILLYNSLAVSVLTVGVLSSLLAGYINPDLRSTSSNLAAVITGLATVMMFVLIDPHLSMLTDEVAEGSFSPTRFRQFIVMLVGSRVFGTLLAQLLLAPGAIIIARLASVI